jgi:hypothetical protein
MTLANILQHLSVIVVQTYFYPYVLVCSDITISSSTYFVTTTFLVS